MPHNFGYLYFICKDMNHFSRFASNAKLLGKCVVLASKELIQVTGKNEEEPDRNC